MKRISSGIVPYVGNNKDIDPPLDREGQQTGEQQTTDSKISDVAKIFLKELVLMQHWLSAPHIDKISLKELVLMQRWLSAPHIEMNTDERLKLYEDTEQFVKHLYEPAQNMQALEIVRTRRQIIKEGFSCSPEIRAELALWIARHPDAGQALNALFNSIMADNSIDPSSFKEFYKCYAKIIENNEHSTGTGAITPNVPDIDKIIFSQLGTRDLLTLRSTSKGWKKIATYFLGQQAQNFPAFEQPVSDGLSQGFPNLNAAKIFFGDEQITHLSLKKLEPMEKIDATSFPQLTHLAIEGTKDRTAA